MIIKKKLDMCDRCGAILDNLDEIIEKREPKSNSFYYKIEGEKEIVSEKCDLGICDKIKIVVKLRYKEKIYKIIIKDWNKKEEKMLYFWQYYIINRNDVIDNEIMHMKMKDFAFDYLLIAYRRYGGWDTIKIYGYFNNKIHTRQTINKQVVKNITENVSKSIENIDDNSESYNE